ncbi:MAG TPA: pentapeptide repeat-containing protein [Ktedonobacteraceae bacterium]
MANQEHLHILKQGPKTWNEWRKEHADIEPDFSRADLSRAKLRAAYLSAADLSHANLSRTSFIFADLSHADLNHANLNGASLYAANLSGASLHAANLSAADLSDADLSDADLGGADLGGANLGRDADLGGPNLGRANLGGANLEIKDLRETTLREANLSGHNLNSVDFSGVNLNGTSLIKTNFSHTNLSNCSIYGIAAWDIQLDEHTVQKNLTITPPGQPAITVDNLKIAQFIYLLLNNAEIREVIDTIAKKAVLILGRFTPERKAILDALREALRTYGYLPILFDFDKPSSQDLTETVSTLAHLSRFIIVDLTDPSSAPYEVGTIASNHFRPIQAIFHPSDEAKRVFSMFPDLVRRYHWVLLPYEYQNQEQLLASLQTKVIEPAEQKAQELEKQK